jgi:dynein heavy chain
MMLKKGQCTTNFKSILLIKGLDKEMRMWDTYVHLEATVKNMLTSLRAVGELQNPAIRERHWLQLMKSTKVSSKLSIF